MFSLNLKFMKDGSYSELLKNSLKKVSFQCDSNKKWSTFLGSFILWPTLTGIVNNFWMFTRFYDHMNEITTKFIIAHVLRIPKVRYAMTHIWIYMT